MKQKKENKFADRKKASALVFAVIVLFVILSVVISLSSITILETKMSQKTKSSAGAFFVADSGIEWALHKIAESTAADINGTFGIGDLGNGKIDCPSTVGDCSIYLINKGGRVITSADPDTSVDAIKSVRSVGVQSVGGAGDTPRAIEAAVAATIPSGM